MQENLRELLESFGRREVDLEEALRRIKRRRFLEVGEVAKLDICRVERIGIPEAILAEGKDKTDLLAISLAHLEATGSVIITGVSLQSNWRSSSPQNYLTAVSWSKTHGLGLWSSGLQSKRPNRGGWASWQQAPPICR